MYHVITKARNDQGQATLIESFQSRDDARAKARDAQGSVKTDEEYHALAANGKIVIPQLTQPEPEPAMQDQHQPDQQPDQQAAPSILDAAEQVATEQAKRTTVGKKEKAEPKRVATDPAVVDQARQYMRDELMPLVASGNLSKVDFVRRMSLWEGRALQRADVLALNREANIGIADATVSTQFQFARSERMKALEQRASENATAKQEREAQKAAEKQQREAQREADKQRREAEKQAKADAKAKAQEPAEEPATEQQ